ncbi:hypothetical protein KHP62_20440 [Rhodobacteraceae bacterium NNCM2]|nr:hypothetical protein [Coraliihabitans acroporae]
MLFAGSESRAEFLKAIENDQRAYENVVAMANVGMAFSTICILEDLVAGLLTNSKAQIKSKLDSDAVSAADLFLERHKLVRASTLGKLVTVMEKSGVSGRDIRYLRAIVELRNDFIHHFMDQVPLPGDWERFGFSLEEFSAYTRFVIRHVHFAESRFSKIMHRHGLLAGTFGDFGAILWNPNDPFANRIFGDV